MSGILYDPVCLAEGDVDSTRTCTVGLIWESKENTERCFVVLSIALVTLNRVKFLLDVVVFPPL